MGWSWLWDNSRINKNKPRESLKSWRPGFPRSTPRFSRQHPQVLRGRRHEWRFRFWQSSRPHWNQIGNRVLWLRTIFSNHFPIQGARLSRLCPISKKRRSWASCDRSVREATKSESGRPLVHRHGMPMFDHIKHTAKHTQYKYCIFAYIWYIYIYIYIHLHIIYIYIYICIYTHTLSLSLSLSLSIHTHIITYYLLTAMFFALSPVKCLRPARHTRCSHVSHRQSVWTSKPVQ